MAIGKIYYRGESGTARIEGAGEEPVRYTPVVCNELIHPEAGITNYGVGFVLDDGRATMWGNLA